MREIVVGTANKNKMQELRTIGNRFGLSLLSSTEAREKYGLAEIPDCEETGTSFSENAILKARVFAAWSGLPSLGDDSGIEVDALGGAPGIFSARYAGEGASDQDRITKLLQELAAVQQHDPSAQRTGRFRCALALVLSDGSILESEGSLEGEVLLERQGSGGFGYDPILWITELGATLAEVDFELTCERGFRAKAASALFSKLPAVL